MNIALLGYGRMGKTIERLAKDRGHQIVFKTSSPIRVEDLAHADVAIEFSLPTAAFQNLMICFKARTPVVSGTTGWLEHYKEAVNSCNKHEAAFIYASNFSLGVNLFFELNKQLATLMGRFKEYTLEIEEIHHTKKLDAPSGTAISLAEQVIETTPYENWELNETNGTTNIPIIAKRIEDVPGTHRLTYSSSVDKIQIQHEALNRDGFALGAIIAAEWLQHKKGVYSMKDVLGL